MKKIILSLMVAAATFFMTSCDQPDVHVHVNVETVPCTFVTSSIVADVDDAEMTRSTIEPREITYRFSPRGIKGTSETIQGKVLEHDNLFVDLVKGETYDAKFFYADVMENDEVAIVNKDVYGFYNTYTNIQTTINDTVTLTRQIGKLTAKVGHIPANTKVAFKLKTVGKVNMYTLQYNPADSLIRIKPDLITGDSLSQYGAISTSGLSKESYIEVFLYQGDKLKKTSKHPYHLNKNKVKTVTFNINNVNPGNETELGDFFIDIDESWGESEDENQQIGKN